MVKAEPEEAARERSLAALLSAMDEILQEAAARPLSPPPDDGQVNAGHASGPVSSPPSRENNGHIGSPARGRAGGRPTGTMLADSTRGVATRTGQSAAPRPSSAGGVNPSAPPPRLEIQGLTTGVQKNGHTPGRGGAACRPNRSPPALPPEPKRSGQLRKSQQSAPTRDQRKNPHESPNGAHGLPSHPDGQLSPPCGYQVGGEPSHPGGDSSHTGGGEVQAVLEVVAVRNLPVALLPSHAGDDVGREPRTKHWQAYVAIGPLGGGKAAAGRPGVAGQTHASAQTPGGGGVWTLRGPWKSKPASILSIPVTGSKTGPARPGSGPGPSGLDDGSPKPFGPPLRCPPSSPGVSRARSSPGRVWSGRETGCPSLTQRGTGGGRKGARGLDQPTSEWSKARSKEGGGSKSSQELAGAIDWDTLQTLTLRLWPGPVPGPIVVGEREGSCAAGGDLGAPPPPAFLPFSFHAAPLCQPPHVCVCVCVCQA